MANERSLLSLLRGMKDEDEREKLVTALTRDEWIAELHGLMRQLRGWLRPAESEGLARVEQEDVALDDAPIGAYEAPALRIELPRGRVVSVRAAGVLSVGAKGWVDMTCGARRAMIVLNRRGVWKVRGPFADRGESHLEALNEDTLAAAIEQLVS